MRQTPLGSGFPSTFATGAWRNYPLFEPRFFVAMQPPIPFAEARMLFHQHVRLSRRLAAFLLLLPACSTPSVTPSVKSSEVPPAVNARVTAPGRIVPAAGIVVVGAMPGEMLEKILVAPGDTVTPGQELVLLSGRDLRAVEYDVARAQMDDARARIDAQRAVAAATLVEAELGVEQANAAGLEIAVQESRIEASRASAALATGELDRLLGLENRLVPAQTIERKRMLVQQAGLDLRAQQAMLEKMKLSAEMGRQAAAAKLEAAKANMALVAAGSSLAALQKTVDAARLRRDLSLVKATTAGRILEVCMHEGEIVGPRPILKMADLSRIHVEAEVDETSIRRIHLGQRVTVDKDKMFEGVVGKVVTIGGIVSPEGVQTLGMPMSSEQRIVRVRVELDDPRQVEDLVNMQVDVDFSESTAGPDSPHASDQ